MLHYLSAYYEATEQVMKESEPMKKYYIPEFELNETENAKWESKTLY
jgi:hypothetical protein